MCDCRGPDAELWRGRGNDGTFLRGLIHVGDRFQLAALARRPRSDWPTPTTGFRLGRLKISTPPRLDGRTIDWGGLEAQPADDPPTPFSYMTDRITVPQIACYITGTTPATHDLTETPIIGCVFRSDRGGCPRYCPSVEDKIVRFGGVSATVFLVEGLDDATVYPNGISTSLPKDVQLEILKTIPASRTRTCCSRGMLSNTTL